MDHVAGSAKRVGLHGGEIEDRDSPGDYRAGVSSFERYPGAVG